MVTSLDSAPTKCKYISIPCAFWLNSSREEAGNLRKIADMLWEKEKMAAKVKYEHVLKVHVKCFSAQAHTHKHLKKVYSVIKMLLKKSLLQSLLCES